MDSRRCCLELKENECIELFSQNLHFIAHRILYMITFVKQALQKYNKQAQMWRRMASLPVYRFCMENAMENSLTGNVLSNRFLRNFATNTTAYGASVYSISTTSSSYVFLQARAENNRQISRVKRIHCPSDEQRIPSCSMCVCFCN